MQFEEQQRKYFWRASCLSTVLKMKLVNNEQLVAVNMCYPPQSSFTNVPNGTLFKGMALWALDNAVRPGNISIEFHINSFYSNRTQALIQNLREGIIDIIPTHIMMTHARYQSFDYSPSVEAGAVRIMSRKVEGVMGSVLGNVFDWVSYSLILISFVFFLLVFYWNHCQQFGKSNVDKYNH